MAVPFWWRWTATYRPLPLHWNKGKIQCSWFPWWFSDGYLETDGYQGYNNLPGIRRCSCWAHTRRYFIDVVPKGKQYDYSNPAVQGVQFCSKLLSMSADHKTRSTHLSREKPIVLKKKNRYSTSSGAGLTSRSHVREAVSRQRWSMPKPERYVDDISWGWTLQFSNNLSENAIRPFTVGRKNWLFSATPKGATASALVYTMIEMAKANELNIYKYLTYLLEHRPSEDMSDEQLEALTPWSKEVQNVCKN